MLFAFDATIEPSERLALLGGKGAGLNEMTSLGIPVPPGFTITPAVGAHFREHGSWPDGLEDQIKDAIRKIELAVGRRFGDADAPLLVSVRSGAAASMPGMMDTILNLGLNDEAVKGLATNHGDGRFALDAYRRLIQMYGDVVLGVPHEYFEDALSAVKTGLRRPKMYDSELDEEALETLIDAFKGLLREHAPSPFPQDVHRQLWGAISAVYASWNNPRAYRYRQMQHIDDALGTACTIQAMVFGNTGPRSGSGVAFTRNPSNGERVLYGEYLCNAQGEDVVAGIRTPVALTASASIPGREDQSLERTMPDVFEEIAQLCKQLESHFGDMQDVEFTIEEGKPYILQTRSAKRTAQAAVRIAVEMVEEGALTREAALLRIDAGSLDQLLHARLPPPEQLEENGVLPLASGLPASPGAATGRVVFHADDAVTWSAEGQEVILVRRETSPEDIHGMRAAQGIVTAAGGMTSHAAVVARGLGKCCVAGVGALAVNYDDKTITVQTPGGDARELGEGDVITLDGTFGKVYEGSLDVVAAPKLPEFSVLMEWADAARELRVRANADTPRAARAAISYGAEGIGLCRTEHMFFASDRLETVRCIVLTDDEARREEWLSQLGAFQRNDFIAIFEAMDGRAVTVRLLDWPLHEFLPRRTDEFAALAPALGMSEEDVRRSVDAHREINPMLGHRGVRVGMTMPSLYATQLRALFGAAAQCLDRGITVRPEIMVPFVSISAEIGALAKQVERVRDQIATETGHHVSYRFGTMIELPRACLVADEIAEHAEFFSFGTNDLTQTTYGISRDDAGRFLPAYLDKRSLERDPFATLDKTGVARLMRLAIERGRQTRAGLEIGVCGEHGGDPESILLCSELGVAYVSCSPPRLPVARMAAAQAALRKSQGV